MKRFFAKASKPLAKDDTPVGSNQLPNPVQSVGLPPKYIVPAVPHPCPHDHIALLATTDGLLSRPQVPGYRSNSYVRIHWEKIVKVVEINEPDEQIDWSGSVVVYGIVGVLELFSCSYLLVISSRSELGNVLEPTHTVYGVKGVTAIPLVYERAKVELNTLASRNAGIARPSLPPKSQALDAPTSTSKLDNHDVASSIRIPTVPHVQFAAKTDLKILSPIPSRLDNDAISAAHLGRPSSAQSSRSDSSSSSDRSIAKSPVFKTLADRLSFWSRLSKRPNSIHLNTESPPFSEPTSLLQEQETLDKMMEENADEPAGVLGNILASTAPAPATTEERHFELETKVVKECIRQFTKGGMYFAYNFDITRSLQHKQEQAMKSRKKHSLLEGLGALPSPEAVTSDVPKDGDDVSPLAEPNPTLPLWRRVDKQYWWNEWLTKPFLDAGLHCYVLPIMQGYFQMAKFNVPSDDTIADDPDIGVDYIIVSRRSRYRAGLRYQRRGIDDDAHVANFVETETIMRVEREGKNNIFAYVQIRGSIPLYWTQTGYGLKPSPLLAPDRTQAQNLDAIGKHFQRTVPVYGHHTIVNLAEQHGKEGAITRGYCEYAKKLDSKDAQYVEYDFHQETKGMKYENISKLIDSMERVFDSQGYLWISDNVVFSQQKGVFRVNCIDCLDRTNVVQSAFARYVLSKQLSALALFKPSVNGGNGADLIFNDVWANNGDAISRAYAGTSALKGDFTRTGKRDLGGLLNDGVNSLARMYTSTFSDWFSQAVIDFMLGYRTTTVFSEFLLKLQSTDPCALIRLSKIRAEAIATSVSRALPEGERLLSGWTLFAPEELNTRICLKFEEKVLLLSVKALYIVSYDYTLEKVKLYTRVPLGDIVSITRGAYILSPLEEASRDPEQNAGFIVTWSVMNQESRTTSYSLKNNLGLRLSNSPSSMRRQGKPTTFSLPSRNNTKRNVNQPLSSIVSNTFSVGNAEQTAFAAFKVLPIDPTRIRRASSTASGLYADASDELNGASSCREAVDLIVDSIYRGCEDAGSTHSNFVTNEDVVSLSEAQRTTSVYAKMEYGVKRLLWLGG